MGKIVKIEQKFKELCKEKSDINEHLPTLMKYASECNNIFETGVRGCISSWALVYGLFNNNNISRKKILLNDIVLCNIDELHNYCKDLNIDIECIWKNNLNIELDQNYDLIFIDTWHVYGQLIRELNKFAPFINKYIIMHDTTIDGIYGETIRSKWNAKKQSRQTGIPVHEINKGLKFAIEDFLKNNSEWKIKEIFTNNNGLTILERINKY